MTRLPRTLDELRSLRAARWVRESTERQQDRFGPDAQREQQDRAIERYSLVDTGLSWSVAHSGRTVGKSIAFGDMLARAGHDYNVLVVGYVSRFARDLRTAVNARHDLHAAGAAILFADERVLSSDEDAWETWARETVEAEAYSRRLGKRITEAYAAKFRQMADQAGTAPIGFHRVGPARILTPDPDTMPSVVHLFERYATGTVSIAKLGVETGYGEEQVRKALGNPLYRGIARRHRGAEEERAPTAWHDAPPISLELWERVQDVRHEKVRGGGRPRPDDLLRGLMYCRCGRRLRSEGTSGSGTRRHSHPEPCPLWGATLYRRTAPVDKAVVDQLSGMRLDNRSIARVVRILSDPTPPKPAGMTSARLTRRRRELALEVAEGRIDDATYLARIGALRAEPVVEEAPAPVEPERVVAALRDMHALWLRLVAAEMTHEMAELVRGVYRRIVVDGHALSADLTPAALALGLDIVLPDRGEQASPAGFKTAGSLSIRIVGRRSVAKTA